MFGAVVFPLVRSTMVVSTYAMKDITEVRMKRQWGLRRQFQPTTDAERRWDQAYQSLLGWNTPPDLSSAPLLWFYALVLLCYKQTI